MNAAQGNKAAIGVLLAELSALGVEECCVCAGARNAPLLEALTRRPAHFRLHSFFEERSAAFFALGRVMRTRKPAAVITTSGTAVAELFPAVMEAHYQALPLVVITADRPPRYRRSGAPQAVEQPGIFGSYVAREVEIEHRGGGDCRLFNGMEEGVAGPIHFNVCLEECLSDDVDAIDFSRKPSTLCAEASAGHQRAWREFWDNEGDVLVLASGIHPDDVPQTREFLVKLNAPVVAEATSNLCGDTALSHLLVRGGEQALKQNHATRVLRLGAVPSWRWWRDLDHRENVRVLNVTRAPFRGMARTQNVSVVPWEMLASSSLKPQASSLPASADKLTPLLEAHAHSEPAWMRHLSRLIGDDALVFLGNSLPIREWNLAADTPEPGTKFFANRGANGIDGLVSTWLGVGAEEAESWLIVGDLSALYDLSAPWILPQLPAAKRRIVVINNGGGKIFSRVAWLKEAGHDTKRVMENPHTTSFEPWARMWGLDYRLITDAASLDDDDVPCAVWEVRPDAAQTEAFWQAWQGQPARGT